ncbi:MAG TPA: sodium:solute symporter [Hellea balneolensis]|uniref:Sodium:solute symporter n=1 Tax=Hellea balneolensis TaxID=287478 RepID=A0A7V5U0V3_9PROT|nr:sodium:solute symporter [Hellea balneolensis]
MGEVFGSLITYIPWPILPPIIAIGLALWTRQVFMALAVGIWFGYMILAHGHPLTGTLATIDAFVNVLTDTSNARMVTFSLIIGPLIALVQRSGGVNGFVEVILRFIERATKNRSGRLKRKIVESFAAFTGLFLFIESNISLFTVGTLYRPVFDKLKIPREKLAYINDSTSAPSNILMPFNAWGAFIMSLLAIYALGPDKVFDNEFEVLVKAIAYNFYPMLTVLLIFIVIWSGKDIGDMKKAEIRARETGKLLRDGAVPMMDDSVSMLEPVEGIAHKARNMLIPIFAMVFLMPTFLIYTGWDKATAFALKQAQEMGTEPVHGLALAWLALSKGFGSGSAAVLYAVSFAILIAMALYRAQGLMKITEMVEISLKAMAGMVNVAILAVLAFALNAMCKELGTGAFVADIFKNTIAAGFIPALIFVIAAFIGFSTGTSWGTFSIMIPVAVPLAAQVDGVNIYMAVAAALGGGVFGDHCSPTSDTTIIASMSTANDHIDHVRTQIPYALIAGAGATILYLILGFLGV